MRIHSLDAGWRAHEGARSCGKNGRFMTDRLACRLRDLIRARKSTRTDISEYSLNIFELFSIFIGPDFPGKVNR
ncbi:hypothetical protein [Paraburkholderia gardini]|uniref:hypothetical protein n=1 Tax=Paraburkholderia gardini TaxID=2823469 RepID=UPI001E502AE9|nr:hypothetical protein [Paraburkholderia gardini]